MIQSISRYDFYAESDQIDPITNERYPDPLSVNFSEGKLSKYPTSKKVDTRALDKWWLFYWENYGTINYDDIFYHINGIPYLGLLEPGSTLYLPVMEDIQHWLKSE